MPRRSRSRSLAVRRVPGDSARVTTRSIRARVRSDLGRDRDPVQGFVQDDEDPRCLAPRLRAVEAKLEQGDAKEADLYVCELRRIKSIKQPPPFPVPHPCALLGARKTKTLRKKQVADALGDLARWTLSWDTQDDGVFVGGRGAGKGLHVVQVLWSNVGHNCPDKLLAARAPGSMVQVRHDARFRCRPQAGSLDALRQASRIVLCDQAAFFS